MMGDPSELALVEKALCSGLSNCVEWKSDRIKHRILEDPGLHGLTPEWIKKEAIKAAKSGVPVKQRVENRDGLPPDANREYWYKIVFDVELNGRIRELFVEMELSDDDDDYPVVAILNAHFQGSAE